VALLALAVSLAPGEWPAQAYAHQAARPAAQVSTAPLTLSPTFLPSGQVGKPYLQAITASGETGPYTFGVTIGTIPPGLGLSADGVLSGTPTTVDSYGFLVMVTDADGNTVSQGYSLNIVSPIAVSPPVLPEGAVGRAYRQIFGASGGNAPYTFAVTDGALPPGLALSRAGALTGTPLAPGGLFSFSVTATDAHGVAGRGSYALLIGQPFSILPGSLPGGEVGVAYRQTLSASGGVAPYSFAVASSPLPTGLTLSVAGLLSGTPSAQGFFSFTVVATDTRGLASRQVYNLSVTQAPLVLSPASLPGGSTGVAYRQSLAVAGGTKPYSFAVTDGALPPGLALGADGRIGGTPTTEGFFFFTVTATDARGRTGTAFYFIVIAQVPLLIGPAILPDGKVGIAYRQRLTASGGTAPYTFAVQGALPPGLQFRSDGRMLGRPTVAGTFFLNIGVTDARGRVGGIFYSLTIAQALAMSPLSLPNGQAGTPYQQTLATIGGRAPYTFAVTDGALPIGLALTPAGNLSGRPAAPGFYGFAITATDSRGVTGSQFYSLPILSPIAVSPPGLLEGKVGTAYRQVFDASGGAAPYSFSVADGALPPGLALSASGQLLGTPTAEGFYHFTISATDARGISGQASLFLQILPAFEVNPPFLDQARVDRPFAVTLAASGGVAPYSFAVTDGALPPGLTLSPTGLLSGTPTKSGFYGFTVTATDARGLAKSQSYFVQVLDALITIGPDTLPDGQVGVEYQQQLAASGGSAPYTFFADFLPFGLVLSPDGLLHGTPNAAGFGVSFDVRVVDARSNRAGRSYTIAIGAIAIGPATLPPATIGVSYTAHLTATGRAGPYVFVVASGSFPPDLTLSRDGTISGNPTAFGFYSFTVAAIDSRGYSSQQFYNLTVVDQLTINPAALPDGVVGTFYSAILSSGGTTFPYRYAVTDGALPPGLALGEGGSISGTPGISGVYTFVVTVTDTLNRTASRSYTIVIN
jgi:hypothetical protein